MYWGYGCSYIVLALVLYFFTINIFYHKNNVKLSILDHILILIVIWQIVIHIFSFLFGIFSFFEPNNIDFVCHMTDSTDTTSRSTKVIHQDGNWSDSIRSLFIYGSAAARIHLQATSNPRKFGIAAGAVIAESVAKFLTNAINGPTYIKDHVHNWKLTWASNDSVSIETQTDPIIKDTTSNFISLPFSGNEWSNFLGNKILIEKIFTPIITLLKPETVDYSIELLAAGKAHNILV